MLEKIVKILATGPIKSEVARRIKQFAEVHGRSELAKRRRPVRTTKRVTMLDGKQYFFWTDGSLRHAKPILRGKAAVKAYKRAARRVVRKIHS